MHQRYHVGITMFDRKRTARISLELQEIKKELEEDIIMLGGEDLLKEINTPYNVIRKRKIVSY
ncbi:MAG: hypothetical protein U9R75_02540 [Candidatus Thermoplasmatota archaeon]|nr:hypothetical protein [Candidatus Thermoplasmatota archaeon]